VSELQVLTKPDRMAQEVRGLASRARAKGSLISICRHETRLSTLWPLDESWSQRQEGSARLRVTLSG
jgi:hypothetical protein